MSVAVQYARLPGESFEDYKVRICENKNVYGLTFEQIADILNAESGNTYTESKWRKEWKSFCKGRVYERNKISNSMLVEQSRELEKQRMRLSEERAALKRIVRDEARADAWREEIMAQIKVYPNLQEHHAVPIQDNASGTLVVLLTDLHIGMQFDNSVGKYNSEIARDRLYQYASEVADAVIRWQPSKCAILLGGDLISGTIHNTIRIENRESIVQQLKLASEYISEFIVLVESMFQKIDVYGVSGNHSRTIQNKDDAMLGDMLDDLVPVYLQARLSTFEHIAVHENKENRALESFYVENNHSVLVHGEYDDMSEANIGKLQRLTGGLIDVVFTAHLHENMFKDVTGVHVIRGGCLSGSGDEYCLKKRLSGQPSQMMSYFAPDGKLKALIPVYFD